VTMNKNTLLDIYNKLYKFFGPQHWWPGDTPLEIIVGAILTQNTAWTNVEKAIANLKQVRLLSSPAKIKRSGRKALARLIRPAGYYNVKSARIKNFIDFLDSGYGLSLKRLGRRETAKLRSELMSVNGIGPETCDSILLYAFKKPVFVVDAYTKRIFSRHGIFSESLSYDKVQEIFMRSLPSDERLYNEYHALIVRLGKELCRKKPDCGNCPLKEHLNHLKTDSYNNII